MMMDKYPDDARADRSIPTTDWRPATERPMTDREVPLRNDGAMAALNAWLDGDAPAPRTANSQLTPEAELWSRISIEAASRRKLRTPSHVAAQIMNALPTSTAARLVAAPAVHTATSVMARAQVAPASSSRNISMPRAAIAIIAAVFMALGAFFGRMM